MDSQPKSKVEKEEGEPPRVVRFELAVSTLVTLVLFALGLWFLFKIYTVLLILVMAFFIVGTLNPAVNWLEKKGLNRGVAIALVFASLAAAIVLMAVVTIPTLLTQASAMAEQEPIWRGRLADRLGVFPLTVSLAKWLRGYKYLGSINDFGNAAITYSMRAAEIIAFGLSGVFIALYTIIDRDRLRGALFAVVPRSHHVRLSRVLMNLETIVGAYIRGQLITSTAITVFIFTLLTCCGIENAMSLAVFAGLADVLSYVGVFIAMVPALIAAFPHGPVVTLVVLALMLFYVEFEARVLVPRVYGLALRLPSALVIFSLLVGWTLIGIVGALFAIPFAATAMMLIAELRVPLPGEPEKAAEEVRREDKRAKEEYERRSEGVPAKQSAAIAVEIAVDQLKEENNIPAK